LEAAKKAKAVSDQKAAEAAAAEEELKIAENLLKQAVDALQAEEKAYKDKCDDLTARGDDPALGAVQKNKAKNELAQLKAEDPLPLRKAKITQEAALKRAERARLPASNARAAAEEEARKAGQALASSDKAAAQAAAAAKTAAAATAESEVAKHAADAAAARAAEAKAQAQAARADAEAKTARAEKLKHDADAAKRAAEAAHRQAESALADAQAAMAAAEARLEEVKAQGVGGAKGDLFWMERTMAEIRKFMPK